MPYFRKHVVAKAIPQHRQLKYSKEMSQKSKVVKALYILFINFIIKQEDKINILEHLTKYAVYHYKRWSAWWNIKYNGALDQSSNSWSAAMSLL